MITSDFSLPKCMQATKEQHAQLCIKLAAFGWQFARLHTFIIGRWCMQYLTAAAFMLMCLGAAEMQKSWRLISLDAHSI